MDVVATVTVPSSAEDLFSYVCDLSNYPSWLDLVHTASREMTDISADNSHDGKNAGVWIVELRARLGLFARSKRLRMTRTICEAPTLVVFERTEIDARRHSAWVLRANVVATESGATLEAHLHYSGNLFTGGVLERALADQIEAGREKLIKQLSAK